VNESDTRQGAPTTSDPSPHGRGLWIEGKKACIFCQQALIGEVLKSRLTVAAAGTIDAIDSCIHRYS
jgi:hypothetical protein